MDYLDSPIYLPQGSSLEASLKRYAEKYGEDHSDVLKRFLGESPGVLFYDEVGDLPTESSPEAEPTSPDANQSPL